jgi:hypothetical protein
MAQKARETKEMSYYVQDTTKKCANCQNEREPGSQFCCYCAIVMCDSCGEKPATVYQFCADCASLGVREEANA